MKTTYSLQIKAKYEYNTQNYLFSFPVSLSMALHGGRKSRIDRGRFQMNMHKKRNTIRNWVLVYTAFLKVTICWSIKPSAFS